VSETAGDGTKKAVCRGFAGILKESPLASQVDPKSFLMMLNTNYSALARDGHIDLGPIFEALRREADEERLLPMFAKFEQKATELGMVAELPTAMRELDATERTRLVETYDAQRGLTEAAPTSGDGSGEDGTSELERRVVNAFVHGFRKSPLGQRMDPSQLSYFLGSQVHELLADGRLRIDPMVEALRQQGITDPEIYVGVALAQEQVRTLDVELVEPSLDVRPEIKRQLLKRAQTRDLPARAKPGPDRADEERKKQLEEFELPAKKQPPGRARVIRVGVLVGLLGVAGATAFFLRPNRPIGTSGFANSIPLKSARLVDGAFSGTIDWAKWEQVPPAEQRKRLAAFEAELRARGLFNDFQLRGPDDQVLVVPVEGTARASPRLYSDFVPGSPRSGDGTVGTSDEGSGASD